MENQVHRFGSPQLVAKLYLTHKSTLSHIQSRGKLHILGSTRIGIGRKAELFVLGLLPGSKDMNELDARCSYDIEHSSFGKINVRASSVASTKVRVKKIRTCDQVAVVLLDKGQQVRAVSMILSSATPATVNFADSPRSWEVRIFEREDLYL